MTWPRILESRGTRIAIGVLVCLNHVMLGALAWGGDVIPLVMLVVFSMAWVFFAVANGIARDRNLESWMRSLDSWEETQNLARDYTSLLVEACTSLSTWDREKSDDIIERARTIGRLRQANVDERRGND